MAFLRLADPISLQFRLRDKRCLYYGLDDGEERTIEEIGSLLGVTRARIRQIRNRTAMAAGEVAKAAEAAGTVWAADLMCRSGSEPYSVVRPRMAAAPLRVRVRTVNGLPFGPPAVDFLASPWRIQAFTARRAMKGCPPKWFSAKSRNETQR